MSKMWYHMNKEIVTTTVKMKLGNLPIQSRRMLVAFYCRFMWFKQTHCSWCLPTSISRRNYLSHQWKLMIDFIWHAFFLLSMKRSSQRSMEVNYFYSSWTWNIKLNISIIHQQRYMNKLLKKFKWRIAYCFINDIMIYFPTFEQHLKNIDEILETLENAELIIQSYKCFIDYHFLKILRQLGWQIQFDYYRETCWSFSRG